MSQTLNLHSIHFTFYILSSLCLKIDTNAKTNTPRSIILVIAVVAKYLAPSLTQTVAVQSPVTVHTEETRLMPGSSCCLHLLSLVHLSVTSLTCDHPGHWAVESGNTWLTHLPRLNCTGAVTVGNSWLIFSYNILISVVLFTGNVKCFSQHNFMFSGYNLIMACHNF